MKKIISAAVAFFTVVSMLAVTAFGADAYNVGPYNVDENGCITSIQMETEKKIDEVSYFSGVVTSHIQGLEQRAAIPYRTYGAIGSENTRMFVYSVGSSDGLDFSRAKVKTIVERFEAENPAWNALVAINGDFFDIETSQTSSMGEPEFPMIQLGNVYKSKVLDYSTGRGVVGTTDDGKMVYYTVGDIYKANKYGTPFSVDSPYTLGIYGEHHTNIVAGYNAYADHRLHTNRIMFVTPDSEPQDFSGATVYVVACDTYRRAHVAVNGSEMGTTGYFIDGEIVEIRDGNKTERPPKGYVYFATAYPEHYELLTVGTHVKCQKQLTGEWADVTNAIGFKQQILAEGKLLLKNCYGRYNTSGDYGTTSWTEDVYDYPHCWKDRTAIGFRDDGTPVLLVLKKSIDTGSNKNLGASYYEIAEQLKALGCTNGFLLDGGGSSTFVIRDENDNFVNAYVGEGSGRAVANAVILAVRDESVPLPEEDEKIEMEVPEPPATERATKKKTEKVTSAESASEYFTSAESTSEYFTYPSDTFTETPQSENKGCSSNTVMPVLAVAVSGAAVLVSRRKRRRK